MATYTGYKTLYEYLTEENIEDGNHSLNVNGEIIDIELYNFYENVVYSTTPILGDNIPDTKMLILKYHKNLTIHSDVVVTPQVRKKGMVILVNGMLNNKGSISMTARGAIAKGQNISLYEDEKGWYRVDPVGGSGGIAVHGYSQAVYRGIPGSSEVFAENVFKTGGGGGGGCQVGGASRSAHGGIGSAGTSYSGGSGGGAGIVGYSGNVYGGNAQPDGGAGGKGIANDDIAWVRAGGGAGNPAGVAGYGGKAGTDGTGGLLVIFAYGISQNENTSIQSNGSNGGSNYGGGSGGGIVAIFCQDTYDFNNDNVIAKGGLGGSNGGSGGDGSVALIKIQPYKNLLIKVNNEIKTIDIQDEDIIIDTNLKEPLNKIDFEDYGFKSIQPLLENKTEKNIRATYKYDLEDGKVYSVSINRKSIPVIEKIQIM